MGIMAEADDFDAHDYLPLSPAVFHILLALLDEEQHGYGIMLAVLELTDGQVHLVPGTLYGAIKRLLKQKLIAEAEDRPVQQQSEERRRYYRLTALGRRVLRAEAERMARLVKQAAARQLLSLGPNLEPTGD